MSSFKMTADVSAGHDGLYYVVSLVAVQYVDAFLTAIQTAQQERHDRRELFGLAIEYARSVDGSCLSCYPIQVIEASNQGESTRLLDATVLTFDDTGHRCSEMYSGSRSLLTILHNKICPHKIRASTWSFSTTHAQL